MTNAANYPAIDQQSNDIVDNGPNEISEKSLFIATGLGFVELIYMHALRGIDVNSFGYDGYTPLILAAAMGRVDCLQALVCLGADVNAPCLQGKTPLFYSYRFDKQECSEFLINCGASQFIGPAR